MIGSGSQAFKLAGILKAFKPEIVVCLLNVCKIYSIFIWLLGIPISKAKYMSMNVLMFQYLIAIFNHTSSHLWKLCVVSVSIGSLPRVFFDDSLLNLVCICDS